MEHRSLSSARLLLQGWALVNIPVTVLILAFFLILSSWDVPYLLALLGGGAVGWAYWEVAVKHWIRWSHRQGATAERIYGIGKPGMLVWNLEMVQRVLGSDQKKRSGGEG
jgi:hypothetical protein